MVETPRVKRWTPGHRQTISPIRTRVTVKAVDPDARPSLAEALGGKPYFWLGIEAEKKNLSSAAPFIEA